jgi:ATP-dependent DNA helicase RecQ
MQEPVVKYSQQFNETLKVYFDKGFRVAKAKVNFMVYWKDEDKQKEVIVVLPRLLLVR